MGRAASSLDSFEEFIPVEIFTTELWVRNDLSWKLRPEQVLLKQLLEDTPKGIALFNISRRWGKSTTCVVFAIEQARARRQHIRYATAFLSDLEEFIIPIFEWALSDCPEKLRPKWSSGKKTFRFPNGSVIKLIGVDKNPNGLRGNAIDILIMDESSYIKNLEYLYKSIIVPATMKRKFKLIFPSTPPESPEHFWAKQLIPKARKAKTYVELTIDDISDLPPEERQRLLDEVGGEDSPTAQREFFCKIIVDSTRAIAGSFKSKLHVAACDPQFVRWMYFGDVGGQRDKTVFLQVGYDHSIGKIVFRRELAFDPQTVSPVIIGAFKDKWGDGQTIVLDASGQTLIDFSGLGLVAAMPQKDDFSAGLLLLNTIFHNNQAIVHPDCELLIRTLSGGLLTKSRLDYERSPDLGHCDAVAAAIYALRGVDRTTDLRPKPKPSEVFTIPRDSVNIENIKNIAWSR